MKILLVAATQFEIAPLVAWLEQTAQVRKPSRYTLNKEIHIDVLYGGVGMASTAFSLGNVLAHQDYQLAIQLGIGGALDPALQIGETVEIISEYFADLGAATAEGDFLSLAQLDLQEQESGIFSPDGQLLNPDAASFGTGLKSCHGISVNTVNGYPPHILQVRKRYPAAQVESMEGAAFFFACRHKGIRFTQIRSISNYVEARNRDRWDIPLAIEALNIVGIGLLQSFQQAAAGETA